MGNKIMIGCDNAGFYFKEQVKQIIEEQGYEVCDVGVNSEDDKAFYPYIAKKVAEKIQGDLKNSRGILICGTGIGMAITANKFKNIRAAVGHDIYSVDRSSLSNDCNVLCFGARVIGIEVAKQHIKEWLKLDGVVKASQDKVDAICEIEGMNFK
ncbi:MAG TPA: ribose 5-phosphate isomerase B [Clostridium sp.]|uniref:ribose 5-phosphate isomerase B n=1 Tax=Clostridium sp. TaxID=1506 RepID=UPI002F94735E